MSIDTERTEELPTQEFTPNPLTQIRQQAQKIARDKSITLLVPGYQGMLGIRYHGLAPSERDAFVTRTQKAIESGKPMGANADLLIRCCEAILGRFNEDSDWEPIDSSSDEPTTFSTGTLPTLMPEFVGDASSAREEVMGLFSPDGSQGFSIGKHAEAVMTWLMGDVEEIDRQLLGE